MFNCFFKLDYVYTVINITCFKELSNQITADPHLGCYSDSFWCGHRGVEDKILNKQCIPLYKLCDGIVDCRNGNDELMCSM